MKISLAEARAILAAEGSHYPDNLRLQCYVAEHGRWRSDGLSDWLEVKWQEFASHKAIRHLHFEERSWSQACQRVLGYDEAHRQFNAWLAAQYEAPHVSEA